MCSNHNKNSLACNAQKPFSANTPFLCKLGKPGFAHKIQHNLDVTSITQSSYDLQISFESDDEQRRKKVQKGS